MKKLTAILLILCLALGFAGCKRPPLEDGTAETAAEAGSAAGSEETELVSPAESAEPEPEQKTEPEKEQKSEPEPEQKPEPEQEQKTEPAGDGVDVPSDGAEKAETEPQDTAAQAASDTERLIPGYKLNPPMPLESSTFDRADAEKVKTLTYARAQYKIGFSPDDATRAIAPDGTRLTYISSEKLAFDREYVSDVYKDDNGNKYKFGEDGRLISFTPNSQDFCRMENYTPELEKQMLAHAEEVAAALYGDALGKYEKHAAERPEDSKKPGSQLESVSLFYGKKAPSGKWFDAIEISVTCDNTVTIIGEPYDKAKLAETATADLSEEGLYRLIQPRINDDFNDATIRFVENKCWLGMLTAKDGHVYMTVVPAVTSDNELTSPSGPRIYYYLLK